MTRSHRRPAPESRTPAPGAAPRAAGGAPPAAGPAPPSQRALEPQPALTLDAIGKKCPVPIIMLADRIREVPIGQTIEVLADDPAAKTDIPAWCTLKSHEFVRASDLPVGWSFLIRRAY